MAVAEGFRNGFASLPWVDARNALKHAQRTPNAPLSLAITIVGYVSEGPAVQ
jgi:hypothetical protein